MLPKATAAASKELDASSGQKKAKYPTKPTAIAALPTKIDIQ